MRCQRYHEEIETLGGIIGVDIISAWKKKAKKLISKEYTNNGFLIKKIRAGKCGGFYVYHDYGWEHWKGEINIKYDFVDDFDGELFVRSLKRVINEAKMKRNHYKKKEANQ